MLCFWVGLARERSGSVLLAWVDGVLAENVIQRSKHATRCAWPDSGHGNLLLLLDVVRPGVGYSSSFFFLVRWRGRFQVRIHCALNLAALVATLASPGISGHPA